MSVSLQWKDCIPQIIIKQIWQGAMERELESMNFNKVYDLIEAPEGIKPIRYELVYKKKNGVNGKVETYVARLVAKGLKLETCFKLWETFSLVVMLKSIKMLLSITTCILIMRQHFL